MRKLFLLNAAIMFLVLGWSGNDASAALRTPWLPNFGGPIEVEVVGPLPLLVKQEDMNSSGVECGPCVAPATRTMVIPFDHFSEQSPCRSMSMDIPEGTRFVIQAVSGYAQFPAPAPFNPDAHKPVMLHLSGAQGESVYIPIVSPALWQQDIAYDIPYIRHVFLSSVTAAFTAVPGATNELVVKACTDSDGWFGSTEPPSLFRISLTGYDAALP